MSIDELNNITSKFTELSKSTKSPESSLHSGPLTSLKLSSSPAPQSPRRSEPSNSLEELSPNQVLSTNLKPSSSRALPKNPRPSPRSDSLKRLEPRPGPSKQSALSSPPESSTRLRKSHLHCFENTFSSDENDNDYGSDDSVKDKTYDPCAKTKRYCGQPFAITDLVSSQSDQVDQTPAIDTDITLAEDDMELLAISPERENSVIDAPDVHSSVSPTLLAAIQTNNRKKLKYCVKPGCGEKCQKKCSTKIDDDHREHLNKHYWSLNWNERRVFMQSNTATAIPKRLTTKEPKITKRLSFSLKNSLHEKVEVCKTFFLTTLGFHKYNDKVLYNSIQKPNIDKRGKHVKIPKIDRTILDTHIDSFNPQISHYRREHAPERKYLPSDLTIRIMFEDFQQKNPDIKFKYDLYRKHLKSRKISFTQLGNEECEMCEAFKIHCSFIGHDVDNMPSDCDICSNHINHRRRYTAARKLYSEHKTLQNNTDTVYFSTDLEKVIMLPRLDTFKRVLFCQRLTAYNQTFAPLGPKSQHDTFAVLWHDAIAGRKQEDIMSCFYEFILRLRDTKYIFIWMDNCTGQNKNWLLFSLMIYLVNSKLICAETITFHYFEPGHTFMSCDHFHHQVELSMKKMAKIYDFVDFCTAVSEANSKRVTVKEMSSTNFLDIEDHVSKRRIQICSPRAYISNMTKVYFQRGSYDLHYENDYDGKEMSLCFLKDSFLKNLSLVSFFKFRENPKGISKDRKTNLISKLGTIMPPHKLYFWENLPESEDY